MTVCEWNLHANWAVANGLRRSKHHSWFKSHVILKRVEMEEQLIYKYLRFQLELAVPMWIKICHQLAMRMSQRHTSVSFATGGISTSLRGRWDEGQVPDCASSCCLRNVNLSGVNDMGQWWDIQNPPNTWWVITCLEPLSGLLLRRWFFLGSPNTYLLHQVFGCLA